MLRLPSALCVSAPYPTLIILSTRFILGFAPGFCNVWSSISNYSIITPASSTYMRMYSITLFLLLLGIA